MPRWCSVLLPAAATALVETNEHDPDGSPYDVHPNYFLAKLDLDSFPVELLAAYFVAAVLEAAAVRNHCRNQHSNSIVNRVQLHRFGYAPYIELTYSCIHLHQSCFHSRHRSKDRLRVHTLDTDD